MMCARPAPLRIVAALLLLVSAAPIAYSQQEDKITLCVPGENVDRDGFEQPVPGSKMAAFHAALRNFLLDHGDSRLQYQVRENAFATFDPANADPRSLMDEVSAGATCPAADYSYTLPVKRANQAGAQGALPGPAATAAPGAAQPSSAARDALYLGWQYQQGQGVPKDAATAARLYEEAARAGLPDAMYRLGLLYNDGNGVSRDPATAVSWFYQAAQLGHPAAQMQLGFALITGNGARHDDAAGFRWLQLAAQAGLPQAQGTLGAMYEMGQGVAQNEPEAVLWFRRAADQGLAAGMFELGQSLRMGRGVARSEGEAIQWYQKSANAGTYPRKRNLGIATWLAWELRKTTALRRSG